MSSGRQGKAARGRSDGSAYRRAACAFRNPAQAREEGGEVLLGRRRHDIAIANGRPRHVDSETVAFVTGSDLESACIAADLGARASPENPFRAGRAALMVDRVGRADHVLAIDQGTTSTRAILFDSDARPVRVAQRELEQHYPAARMGRA